MTRRIGGAGFGILLVMAARAIALDAPALSLTPTLDVPASTPASAPAINESSYGITGNSLGARHTLQQHHITVGGSVLLDVSRVLRGGLAMRLAISRCFMRRRRTRRCGTWDCLSKRVMPIGRPHRRTAI